MVQDIIEYIVGRAQSFCAIFCNVHSGETHQVVHIIEYIVARAPLLPSLKSVHRRWLQLGLVS